MHREHRNVGNRLLHDRGRAHAEQVRRVHRPHHADARRADAHVHEVDEPGAARAAPRSPRTRRDRGRGRRAVSSSPTSRTPTATPSTDRGAHRLEHLDREAHAVVERAAVLVGAPVVLRREELVDQVAVRGVHLDAVEAGVGGVARRCGRSARPLRGSRASSIGFDASMWFAIPDADHTGSRDHVAWLTPPLCASCRNASAPCSWICSLTRAQVRHARRDPTPRRCCASGTRWSGAPAPGPAITVPTPPARVLGEVAAVALAVEPGLAVRPVRLGVHREVRAAHDTVARLDRTDAQRREETREAHAVRLARRGACARRDDSRRQVSRTSSSDLTCPSACRRRPLRGPS